MKQYKIIFYGSFCCKDNIIERITIEKHYKAKNVEHLKEKINKFLNKMYNYDLMNYNFDNYDIKEV